MVSGLVTSPCDQLRIFSGEASMMRIASKSVMGLDNSNGFERNKATLPGGCWILPPRFSRDSLVDPSFPGGGVCRFQRRIPKTVLSRQLSVFSSTAQPVHFVDHEYVSK